MDRPALLRTRTRARGRLPLVRAEDANLLGVRGYAGNLDDGRVEVSPGNAEQVETFAGHLWKGPNFADVRGVDEQEAALERVTGFDIER